MNLEFKLSKKQWAGIIAGVIIAGVSIAIFRGNGLMYFLLVISLIIAILPFVLDLILVQGEQKEKEEKFLFFVRDLVENVRSGTPVSRSIMNLKKRNYGSLSPHIEKLANQLSIGMTLTDSLIVFSKDTESKVISRAVWLISEAERAGGKIETILESVASSINQIEILRKERKAAISNLVTQGYIIFMVFIVIMLVLEFKILPLVSSLGDTDGFGARIGVDVGPSDAQDLSMPLFIMILVQSLFAGLVIGKISEGSIRDGIKHSFILLTITLLTVTGSRVLFGTS